VCSTAGAVSESTVVSSTSFPADTDAAGFSAWLGVESFEKSLPTAAAAFSMMLISLKIWEVLLKHVFPLN